jgi:hypothetical protein
VVGIADTVLIVVGNAVTNYTISANYFCKGATPVGFPQWFTYTPTGISATNVTLQGRFRIIGRSCEVQFHADFSGAITFTTMPTLPIQAGGSILMTLGFCGQGTYKDAGTATLHNGLLPKVPANAIVVYLCKADDTDMSASVPITWANNDYIDLHFNYEI